MKHSLAAYLHDHLAGATFAVEMLEALQRAHPTEKVGATAKVLLTEIEADRAVLQNLIERVAGGTSPLKEAVSWLSEKASRLKLRRSSSSALGTFETVEALALGILGKEHLWRALAVAALDDPRIAGQDYPHLVQRAEAQHAIVDELRISLVRTALVESEE